MKSFYLFLFFVRLSFCHVDDNYLPKCCPERKVISLDGKSCVQDPYRDNTTDLVEVHVGNKTVLYKLRYQVQFSCVRHETHVVDDSLYVVGDTFMVVVDKDQNWTLSDSQMCVDSVVYFADPDQPPQRIAVALLCPSCQDVVCVHKCCPGSDRLQVNEDATNVECVSSTDISWSLERTKQPFVFHGFPECPRSLYVSYPSEPVEVATNGNLILKNQVSVLRTEYCGEYNMPGTFVLLACRQPLTASFKPTFYGVLVCVGAVFIALTIGLHLWLPDLRASLHARILLAHLFCMLVAFLSMGFANLAPLPSPSPVCSATAFTIQFSILASIFWLNVMCIDIAWTFSGVRAPRASLSMDSDGHKYVYYSMYAWGSTITICLVTAVLEYGSVLPAASKLKPSFGVLNCWFRYPEAALLFVFGPMGSLLLINIGLFMYTTMKIRRTKKDTATIVQHAGPKLREDRDRFSLYLKLFCLMGVTWMFEVISWMVGGSDSYWYVTDIINALRGVFIFVLFCLKKKVIKLVKDKFKKKPKFPMYPRKSTSSKTTSSMSSQRTNSFQLSQVS